MSRETFEICDRCGYRIKAHLTGGGDNPPILMVRVVFVGGTTVEKDLCRSCRIDLGKFINDPKAEKNENNQG